MVMGKISARELKDKYFQFFQKQGHKVIPSAPLVPENDPSVLFISAGMQPLVPFLLGEPHLLGKRLVNIQECVRTVDIGEVGDTYHHTWFEMLGHWSLGDYWKKEAIKMTLEFLTKDLGLDFKRLAFSVFKGNKDAPKDKEAVEIWKSLGADDKRIVYLANNWWGLLGGGPCGPNTEVFYWSDNNSTPPEEFDPKDITWLEIGNDVLLAYDKQGEKCLPAKQNNIDNGTGIERTLAVVNGFVDNYQTSIFWPIIKKIESISGQKYEESEEITRAMRIVADHLRSAVFITADGVEPGNKEQGYVLRRLIRRAVREGEKLGLKKGFTREVSLSVLDNQENYGGEYPELNKNQEKILSIINKEEESFRQTLNRGLKEFLELVKEKNLTGLTGFNLYQTHAFPFEMIIEEANRIDYKLPLNFKFQFQEAKKGHQKLSQAAAKGKFKGGLSGSSKKVVAYHTATHLLQGALREVLGEGVYQAGSNITQERLRFDFTYDQGLTEEQIKKVEKIVNEKIKEKLVIEVKVMKFSQALEKGILSVPGVSYPEEVKVYSIGDYSKEICGGPHIAETGKLKGRFKIIKQEALGQGKRRVYAVLEN